MRRRSDLSCKQLGQTTRNVLLAVRGPFLQLAAAQGAQGPAAGEDSSTECELSVYTTGMLVTTRVPTGCQLQPFLYFGRRFAPALPAARFSSGGKPWCWLLESAHIAGSNLEGQLPLSLSAGNEQGRRESELS